MNNCSNLLKNLYLIGFILIFFTQFVIFLIPNSGLYIPVGLIIWLPFVLYFGSRYKFFAKYSKYYRYYYIFLIYILLNILINYMRGYYTAPFGFYFVRLLSFFITAVLIFYYSQLAILLNIKMKRFINFFYLIIYAILILAFIQYISYFLNFNFFEYIYNFFTNLSYTFNPFRESCKILKRVFAIFSEPSELGIFIFIFMPFIINISLSNYKICKNKYHNFIIKKSFIPLMILILILTKSPIYIIFCLLASIYYLFVSFKKNGHKTFIIIVILSVLLLFIIGFMLFGDYLIYNTFISRIVIVLKNIQNLNTLIIGESSLATRILDYIRQFNVFLKHSFVGIGFTNIECYLNKFYLDTSIPHTFENLSRYYIKPYSVSVCRSLFFTLSAEIGLLGIISWSLFLFSIMRKIDKVFINNNFFTLYATSIKQSLFMIIIISFYNLNITSNFIWLVLGLALMYIVWSKKENINV